MAVYRHSLWVESVAQNWLTDYNEPSLSFTLYEQAHHHAFGLNLLSLIEWCE